MIGATDGFLIIVKKKHYLLFFEEIKYCEDMELKGKDSFHSLMDIYCCFRGKRETSVTSAEPGGKGLDRRGKKSPSHYIHSLIYYYTYFPLLTWITIMINKFNIFLLIKKNEHAITSSLTYSYNGRSR